MAYTPQTSRRKVYPHGTRGPRQDRVKDDAFLGTLKIALEGLFGDANWSTDEAFKSLADSKGWIPLVRQTLLLLLLLFLFMVVVVVVGLGPISLKTHYLLLDAAPTPAVRSPLL